MGIMLDNSNHFQDILNLLKGSAACILTTGFRKAGSIHCRSLLHLRGCPVDQPGFVLTVKLLQIRQLNFFLLLPGPSV